MAVILLACFQYTYSQSDSLSSDSIGPFHRKKGDVLNYFLVDNINNPALAGSLKSYQAQAVYGHTLPGSLMQYHYGNIMLDMFFGNKQGRHGLAYRMAMKRYGFTTAIRQRFDYSFQCINKKNVSLRFGVGLGFQMEQYGKPVLTYYDQIDDRYGFVYSSQELPDPMFDVAAFRVTSFNWNAGVQLRIYDGYINFYNVNDLRTNLPDTGTYRTYFPSFGLNALYNVDLKVMQMIPSFQFNHWGPQTYLIQGGILLASNTSKGGGGGVYFNNNHIFTLSGLFAWNDFLRVYAQVQFPFSDIRYSYPVSNFQITVSYKINDFEKYE